MLFYWLIIFFPVTAQFISLPQPFEVSDLYVPGTSLVTFGEGYPLTTIVPSSSSEDITSEQSTSTSTLVIESSAPLFTVSTTSTTSTTPAPVTSTQEPDATLWTGSTNIATTILVTDYTTVTSDCTTTQLLPFVPSSSAATSAISSSAPATSPAFATATSVAADSVTNAVANTVTTTATVTAFTTDVVTATVTDFTTDVVTATVTDFTTDVVTATATDFVTYSVTNTVTDTTTATATAIYLGNLTPVLDVSTSGSELVQSTATNQNTNISTSAIIEAPAGALSAVPTTNVSFTFNPEYSTTAATRAVSGAPVVGASLWLLLLAALFN